MKPLLALVAIVGFIEPAVSYGQETPPAPDLPDGQSASERSESASPALGGKSAQAPAEQDEAVRRTDSAAALQKQIARLEQRMQELSDELQTVRKVHAEEVAQLTEMITANAQAIRAANELIKSNTEAVESNAELVKSMQSLVEGNARVIADTDRKLRDLAIQDGQGGYTIDMLGNMQKPQFQRELQQVTQGKLWIHNPGSTERVLYINGTPWQAIAGWSYVWVPFGKVGVTDVPGATPVARDNWSYSQRRRQYELVFDFNAPWRAPATRQPSTASGPRSREVSIEVERPIRPR